MTGLSDSLLQRLFVACLAGLLALPALARGDAPPNIVIIVADDLGWNDVGYNGSEIQTPSLDALAEGGVQLSRFYVQSSCSPTRSELMSGHSALALGIIQPFSKLQPAGLPLSVRLLPEYFQDAGYQTMLVGKWHLGFRERAYHPTSRGFDHFYGNLTGGVGYWDHVHGGGLDWQRNGVTAREEGYATHLLRDEAVRLVRERDDERPFLLYLAFTAPHLPNEAPEVALAEYAAIADPRRRAHAAMVTEMDAAIGEVIATLGDEGLLQETLVLFFSDNGGLNPGVFPKPVQRAVSTVDGWFGESEIPLQVLEFVRVNVMEGAADNTPLRGGKQSVYEGGIRVPALVNWPGTLPPGEALGMVTVADVLPTLLAAAGLPPIEAPGAGSDRWPVVQGAPTPRPSGYAVSGIDGEALVRYPWKLVSAGEERSELYNLAEDPGESNDLAASHPERVSALREELEAAPRAESLSVPLWRVALDPDFFGGREDRPPWPNIYDAR